MTKVYHSWKPLLDMHATLSICDSDRDIGKSFPMMMRAIKRGWKRGNCMLWLRRTEKEYKSVLATFRNEKWQRVCKLVGVDIECLRRQGDYILMTRKNGDHIPLIHYGAISEYMSLRDTDTPALDLVYLDEAFAAQSRLSMYRGDEVGNAMDILKSMRRDDRDVRMIIAGNREALATPWYDYFGVKRPDIEAGRLYLTTPTGERIAWERARKDNPDPKFMALVSSTSYGTFMRGEDKGVDSDLFRKLSPKAVWYANVDFGRRLSIWRDGGYFIFSTVYMNDGVVADHICGRPEYIPMSPVIKRRFSALRMAYRSNKVRFADKAAYVYGMEALKKLI